MVKHKLSRRMCCWQATAQNRRLKHINLRVIHQCDCLWFHGEYKLDCKLIQRGKSVKTCLIFPLS